LEEHFDTTLFGNYLEHKALLGKIFECKMPVTRRAKYKANPSTRTGSSKSVDLPSEPAQAKETPTAANKVTSSLMAATKASAARADGRTKDAAPVALAYKSAVVSTDIDATVVNASSTGAKDSMQEVTSKGPPDASLTPAPAPTRDVAVKAPASATAQSSSSASGYGFDDPTTGSAVAIISSTALIADGSLPVTGTKVPAYRPIASAPEPIMNDDGVGVSSESKPMSIDPSTKPISVGVKSCTPGFTVDVVSKASAAEDTTASPTLVAKATAASNSLATASAATGEAPVFAKPTFNGSSMAGVTASSAAGVKAYSAMIASPESHVASTVGSSLATVANVSGFAIPSGTPSSTRDAKAGPTV